MSETFDSLTWDRWRRLKQGILTISEVGAMIPEEDTIEGELVDQDITLDQLIKEEPDLEPVLLDVAKKLVVARRMQWIGKVEVNIHNGRPNGSPTLKVS